MIAITELFKKRLNAFFASWRNHKQFWGNSDIIVISSPAAQASNNNNIRSSSSPLSSRGFFLWLFGDYLAGTTAVFTLSPWSITFLCTPESFSGLRNLAGYALEVMKIPVVLGELKARNPDEAVSEELDKTIGSVRLTLNYGDCVVRVGCIEDEIPKSKVLYQFSAGYRIARVDCGVRMLIILGTHKNDHLLANNIIEFKRSGGCQTWFTEDKDKNKDKAKLLLSLSAGSVVKQLQSISNQIKEMKNIMSLCEAETSRNGEKMKLENLVAGKFEKANKPSPPPPPASLVEDQRKNMMEGETKRRSSYVKEEKHEENKNEQLLLPHKSEEAAKQLLLEEEVNGNLPSKSKFAEINNVVFKKEVILAEKVQEESSNVEQVVLLAEQEKSESSNVRRDDNGCKVSGDDCDWEIIKMSEDEDDEEGQDIANNSSSWRRWMSRRGRSARQDRQAAGLEHHHKPCTSRLYY